MFRARVKDSGREVLAVQIGDGPVWYTAKHPLICSRCDAGVHGKGTYVKRNGASYRAHFALNPRTSHEASCPFNPVEFITSIARETQGLAHVDDGVLKLTLPGDVEDLAPPLEHAQAEPPLDTVPGQRIDTVSPPLPPLLNCAAKVARFLQLNAFDDKAVKRFRVQPHGHKSTIPWGRFCYGPSSAAYGELVQRLDPVSPGRSPSHPVAVYGTVQRVHHDRTGRPFVFLAEHTDLDGQEFEVVLRSMHPTLIQPLTVGTHVLAVGAWGAFLDGRVPQLRLFAQEAWQIAYWHTDEDTGSANQPVSPPAVTAHQRATERATRGPSKRTSRRTEDGQRTAAPPMPSPPPPPSPSPSPTPHRAVPPVPPAEAPDAPSASSPAEQSAVLPQPASPPSLPPTRRRKGFPGWLGRSRKRRR